MPTPKCFVSTPNSLCPYLQIFDRMFCGCTTNQSKQNKCQRSIFLSFILQQCVNSHLQLYRHTTLGRLYFVYICKSCSQSKTTEHFLQKQCTVCAAFADADMSFFERLLSGRSLFPWFYAFFLLFVRFVKPLFTDSFEFKPTM